MAFRERATGLREILYRLIWWGSGCTGWLSLCKMAFELETSFREIRG